MRIKVTQEHIDKGIPKSYICCPIALACQEALSRPVCVNKHGCIISSSHTYCHDKKVEEFVINFDEGKPVTPFEFELEPHVNVSPKFWDKIISQTISG